MHHYLKELNSRFKKGQRVVNTRRLNWLQFSNLALRIFEEVKREAEQEDFFETINFRRSDPAKTINQNFLHFWAGIKHTGMANVTDSLDSKNRKLTSWQAVVEDSGCLAMSQAPNGGVYFILFPCQSKVSSWKDEYIIFKYFSDPIKIEYSDIKDAVEFYLKFMLITSFCSEPTRLEKFKIAWLKFRFADQWYNLFKGAGTVAKLTLSMLKGF